MLGPRAQRLQLHLPPFDVIFGEDDAELMCWRLTQEIPRRTGGWLPPELEPYIPARRPRRALRRAGTAAGRTGAAALGRRAHGHAPAQHPPRARLSTPPRTAEITVTTQVRMTSPRMQDAPRTAHQLAQLQSELRRRPGLLPTDQALLLHAVIETHVSGWQEGDSMNSSLARMLRRVGDSPLVTWSDDCLTIWRGAPG